MCDTTTYKEGDNHPGCRVYDNFRAKLYYGLSMVQFAVGQAMAPVGGQLFKRKSRNGHAAVHIILGLLFIVTGAFAHATYRKRNQCMITTALALNLLCAVAAAGDIYLAISGIWEEGAETTDGNIAFGSVLAVILIVELVLAAILIDITAGAICCRTNCSGKKLKVDQA